MPQQLLLQSPYVRSDNPGANVTLENTELGGFFVHPGTSIWITPGDAKGKGRQITRGEHLNERGLVVPTYEERIIDNLGLYIDNKKAVEAGVQPKGEWGGASKEYYSRILEWNYLHDKAQQTYPDNPAKHFDEMFNRAVVEGGILTSRDYPTLKSTDQQIKLEINEPRDSVLFEAVTRETTNLIEVQMTDTFTPPGISRKLGEFDFIYAKKGLFTRTQFQALEKDGAHIAWNEQFTLTSYGPQPGQTYNIKQMHIDAIPKQMERSKILKIAALITAITGTAVTTGLWGAKTGPDNTYDPYPDIKAMAKLIEAAKGELNTFVSANDAFIDFTNSTMVRGINQPGPVANLIFGNRVVNAGPVDGADFVQKWVIDGNIPTSWVAMYDRAVMLFLQGPQRQFEYTDNRLQQSGRIWLDWNLAYNKNAARTKRLTGVAP